MPCAQILVHARLAEQVQTLGNDRIFNTLLHAQAQAWMYAHTTDTLFRYTNTHAQARPQTPQRRIQTQANRIIQLASSENTLSLYVSMLSKDRCCHTRGTTGEIAP